MEKDVLIKTLENPFDGLNAENLEDFKNRCSEIAEALFCNFCINCNDKEYYFAEVEFYYYEKCKWNEDWNKVTYARSGYNAGDLLYHLSGIDICFESNYCNDTAKFGGILIRAIKDENNRIIAGPLTCKDELLNACKGNQMPQLASSNKKHHFKLATTYRALGQDAINKKIDKIDLCFYDGSLNNDSWRPYTDRYDKNIGKIKPVKSSYKTNRFKF